MPFFQEEQSSFPLYSGGIQSLEEVFSLSPGLSSN